MFSRLRRFPPIVRVAEPPLMRDPEQVAAFDAAGAPGGGLAGVVDVVAACAARMAPANGSVLDLGCGSGRVLAALKAARHDLTLFGLDGSSEMLALARTVTPSAWFLHGDLGEDWPSADLLVSSFALHHLPDAAALQELLRRLAGRVAGGAAALLFDFVRPDLAQWLAAEEAGPLPEEPASLHQDRLASLKAAWTQDELRAGALAAGLSLQLASASPHALYQLAWAGPRRGHRVRPPPLERLFDGSPLR